MPTVLGKRKTRPSDEEAAAARAKALSIFQQHFEAQFKPLGDKLTGRKSRAATEPQPRRGPDDDDQNDETISDESESEWGGVSESESRLGEDENDKNSDDNTRQHRVVEVVDYSTANSTSAPIMTKQEMKKFMSSRPPASDPSATRPHGANVTNRDGGGAEKNEEDSAAFLAKDLELQRLISESHILSAAGGNPAYYTSGSGSGSGSSSGTAPAEKLFGAGRVHKLTTDMRLRALGAKGSILAEGKMPMAMRKGMAAAAAGREEKRRREARENGIVLEKPKAKAASKNKKPVLRRGERRVDLPGVGKMRGAELKISSRDIRSVEGPARGAGGKRERHKRRR